MLTQRGQGHPCILTGLGILCLPKKRGRLTRPHSSQYTPWELPGLPWHHLAWDKDKNRALLCCQPHNCTSQGRMGSIPAHPHQPHLQQVTLRRFCHPPPQLQHPPSQPESFAAGTPLTLPGALLLRITPGGLCCAGARRDNCREAAAVAQPPQ